MSNHSGKYLTQDPLFSLIPPLIVKPLPTAYVSNAEAWVIGSPRDSSLRLNISLTSVP